MTPRVYYKPSMRRDLHQTAALSIAAGVGTVAWVLFLYVLARVRPEWDAPRGRG